MYLGVYTGTSGTNTELCPVGWFRFDGLCTWKTFSEQEVSYTEAVEMCTSQSSTSRLLAMPQEGMKNGLSNIFIIIIIFLSNQNLKTPHVTIMAGFI